MLRFVPKNYLSYFLGKLAGIGSPRPIAQWVIKTYADFFKVDLSAASQPISEYRSLADFFVRDLKSGLFEVPKDAQLVSPVEGTMRGWGKIRNGEIEQIKGKNYSVKDFLADSQFADLYTTGSFINLYLAPYNYHQVHSPVSGKISASTYIPGKLWPVNDWSLASIEGLFGINERIVTYIDSALGKVAVVMVGATNVGKMTVSYDDWCTNHPLKNRKLKPFRTRKYDRPVSISAGDKLGIFHMGSTVVLLFPDQMDFSSLSPGAISLNARIL